MSHVVLVLMLSVIGSGSLLIAGLPLALALIRADPWMILGALALFPFLFIPSLITLAGLMSHPTQTKIIPGCFPREDCQRIHGGRRAYGMCWALVVHLKPFYGMGLAMPRFRRYTLRLFGYKGPSTAFVVHSDTWLRDLPMLKIGKDAHLAHRSILGTNICCQENTIMVDSIRIHDKALVGPLAVLAPGCHIEAGAEVGDVTSIGLRSWIGPHVLIQAHCLINHDCQLDQGCRIGSRSYLGLRAYVGKGVHVPAGSHIPEGTVILDQLEMDRHYQAETRMLQDFAASLGARPRHPLEQDEISQDRVEWPRASQAI